MANGVLIVVTTTRKHLERQTVSVFVMVELEAVVEFGFNGEDQGTYYDVSSRCITYLNKHESLEDITKTVDHEVFHFCIDKLNIEIDDEQEHKMIYYLQWADEYIDAE